MYYTDKSGCIVCLDVATQEVLWEQKELQGHFSFDLMVLSSGDLENSLIRGDTNIIVCDSQVIVHDYFSTIIALSAQSGEILWQHEVQMHWGDISISQDRKIAAYTAIVGKERIVEFLDLSTGEVLMSVQIRDDAYWKAADELPTLLFKGHSSAILTKGALSEDAVLFAGSFVEKYQDGSTALCYYVANRLTGSFDLICRQKISVSSDAYGASVCFADQDQCLIVVHLDGNPDYTFTVDKITLTDNSMLWSTRSRDEYDTILHGIMFQDETTTYLEWDLIQSLKNDRHVVVYCGEQLYVLDSETGIIIFAESPPEEVIKLQWINESSFGAIMKDGKVLKYRIGADAVKATIPSALISPTYQTDISHDSSGLFYEDMYTQLQGNGAIASLPQNDGYFIELYRWNEKTFRPSNINTFAAKNGLAYFNSYSAYIDDTTLMLGSAPVPREDFEIGDTYNTYYGKRRFILIDTEEQRLKKYCDIPFVTDFYCWHPNHKFMLQYDTKGNLILVKVETDDVYVLSSAYTSIEDDAGETKYISNGYRMDVDIRNADGMLNVVRSEAKGFTYWNFVEDQSSYEFFFEYYSPLDDSVKSKARVGKNGFLGVLNKRENATRSSEFTIIDTMDNCAYYGSFEGDQCCHDFWLADHSDLLVTSHEDNSLTVYKITEEKMIHRISLPFPYQQIASIQFIMDEQFLLIQGIDGQVSICNIESGVFVYQEWDGKVIALSEIHYAEDPVNQRLYVRKVNYRDMMTSGSCIDTRTWTKIVDIPGFVTYDVKTDTIYRWCMDMSGAISLYASNLPGTAELISIAKELFQ